MPHPLNFLVCSIVLRVEMVRLRSIWILLAVAVVIALATGCEAPQAVPPTQPGAPSASVTTAAGIECRLNLERNDFEAGEEVKATFSLKNTGDNPVVIAYLPAAPFTVLLYDREGGLVESWTPTLASTAARPDRVTIEPGKSFSTTVSFPIQQKPDMYRLAGTFNGTVVVPEASPSVSLTAGQTAISVRPGQVPPSPLPEEMKGPEASGVADGLELILNLEKSSFAAGESLKGALTLKNLGDKLVQIEYFPASPYTLFLYDQGGNLVETWRGPLAASAIPSGLLQLEPGKSFTVWVSYPVKQKSGTYQIAAAFIGVAGAKAKDSMPIMSGAGPEAKALVITSRVPITITE